LADDLALTFYSKTFKFFFLILVAI